MLNLELILNNVSIPPMHSAIFINGKKFSSDFYQYDYMQMLDDIYERYGKASKVTKCEEDDLFRHLYITCVPEKHYENEDRRCVCEIYVQWSRRFVFYGDASEPSTDFEKKVSRMIENGEITPDNDDLDCVYSIERFAW